MKIDAVDWMLTIATLVAVTAACVAMHIVQLDSKPRACTLTELIQRTSLP